MLTCRQATQLLSERQDRRLKLNEKLPLSLHTGMCPACRRFGQQVAQLSLLAKQYRAYQSPDSTAKSADASSEADTDKPDQTNHWLAQVQT